MKPALVALLLLGIGGCSTPPSAGSTTTPAAPAADAVPNEAELAAYVWELQEAVDATGKRIAVLFPPDARGRLTFDSVAHAVSGHYGCNSMGGRYVLDARGVLANADDHGWMSTLMGCDVNAAEGALADLFRQPLQLRITTGDLPLLTLDRIDGTARTRWRGVPTLDTRYGQAGERLHLEIAAQPMHCPAPLPPRSQCLRVREVPEPFDIFDRKADPGRPWRALEGISGYTHDPRMHQKVVVKRYRLPAVRGWPAEDRYVLESVTMGENVELAQ